MTKEIPELNDLTKGINDPDITPTGRFRQRTATTAAGEASCAMQKPPTSRTAGTKGWSASSTATLQTRWTTATSRAVAVPTS